MASATSGLPAGEDYLAPVENKKPARWFAVARVGQNGLLAADSRGRLTQLQYRAEPVRHLAEVRSKNLDRPLDVPFAVVGSRVVYADAGRRAARSRRARRSIRSFTREACRRPRSTACGASARRCSSKRGTINSSVTKLSGTPKLQFRVPLGNTGPAGPPALVHGRLVVANRDGTLLALDPATGAIVGTGRGRTASFGRSDFRRRPVGRRVDRRHALSRRLDSWNNQEAALTVRSNWHE